MSETNEYSWKDIVDRVDGGRKPDVVVYEFRREGSANKGGFTKPDDETGTGPYEAPA